MPTAEEPLKQYATNGYEVHHIAGTSHFPMIEKPHELNQLREATINEISQGKSV